MRHKIKTIKAGTTGEPCSLKTGPKPGAQNSSEVPHIGGKVVIAELSPAVLHGAPQQEAEISGAGLERLVSQAF